MEHTEPDSTVSVATEKPCSCHSVPKWATELVMWRDVKKTAPVFLGGLVFLTMLISLSLISAIAYIGLFILVDVVVLKAVGKFAPKLLEGSPISGLLCGAGENKKFEITREQAERFVDVALPHMNQTIEHVQVILSLNNPVETAKHTLIFWILTYIGAYFNLLTLITIAFVLVFTVPRVYEQFQPQFDNLGALLKQHLDQVLKLAHTKIEELKQKFRERSGKEKAQ